MVKNKYLLLLGTLLFILLAIALVSILNRTNSSQPAADVRAKAAITNILELNGTVNSIDEAKGEIILDGVYLSDESRVGTPKGMGSWVVVPPNGFNFASLSAGQSVKVGIDPKSFLVESHTVTAITLVPVSR